MIRGEGGGVVTEEKEMGHDFRNAHGRAFGRVWQCRKRSNGGRAERVGRRQEEEKRDKERKSDEKLNKKGKDMKRKEKK